MTRRRWSMLSAVLMAILSIYMIVEEYLADLGVSWVKVGILVGALVVVILELRSRENE